MLPNTNIIMYKQSSSESHSNNDEKTIQAEMEMAKRYIFRALRLRGVPATATAIVKIARQIRAKCFSYAKIKIRKNHVPQTNL